METNGTGQVMTRAKARFDRSTWLTALRLSKGKLTTLSKVEGQNTPRAEH
jgi:hypothetical protein